MDYEVKMPIQVLILPRDSSRLNEMEERQRLNYIRMLNESMTKITSKIAM